jgi:hypothetical protein
MEDDDTLPEKVSDIDILRILKGRGKQCYCSSPRFVLRRDTRTVYCRRCGAEMDAFEALTRLAMNWDAVNQEVNRLLEERKALLAWQPHRIAARRLVEVMTRKGSANLIPVCPHCGRGIEYEALTHGAYVDRELDRYRQSQHRDVKSD